MPDFELSQHPHRRYNPLLGQWVLVSPHRAQRPWQGQQEAAVDEDRPAHDPTCYLCPGNTRAGGEVNPPYASTFVFGNDFAALKDEPVSGHLDLDGLLRAEPEPGLARVICFSPRHDLTLPEMEPADIRRVVDLWVDQYREIGSRPGINHVLIFENKGAVMGCSNPHPHGQIWAQATVPQEPAAEDATQAAYFRQHGRTLLADYLTLELQQRERIVLENEHFVVLVPFWAVWPFETLLLPKRPQADITEMSDAQRTAFADALRRLTIRYDNLFQTSFPYSAGIHQRPTDGAACPHWHWHMHFYPPLLRSATVKKFYAGYELLAAPARDITPEQAAERLRSLPDLHYKTATSRPS